MLKYSNWVTMKEMAQGMQNTAWGNLCFSSHESMRDATSVSAQPTGLDRKLIQSKGLTHGGPSCARSKSRVEQSIRSSRAETDSASLHNTWSVWSVQYIFINLNMETLPFWKSLLNWFKFFLIYLWIKKTQRFRSKESYNKIHLSMNKITMDIMTYNMTAGVRRA